MIFVIIIVLIGGSSFAKWNLRFEEQLSSELRRKELLAEPLPSLHLGYITWILKYAVLLVAIATYELILQGRVGSSCWTKTETESHPFSWSEWTQVEPVGTSCTPHYLTNTRTDKSTSYALRSNIIPAYTNSNSSNNWEITVSPLNAIYKCMLYIALLLCSDLDFSLRARVAGWDNWWI